MIVIALQILIAFSPANPGPHIGGILAIRELRNLFNEKNHRYIELFESMHYVDATPLCFVSKSKTSEDRISIATQEFENFRDMRFTSLHSTMMPSNYLRIIVNTLYHLKGDETVTITQFFNIWGNKIVEWVRSGEPRINEPRLETIGGDQYGSIDEVFIFINRIIDGDPHTIQYGLSKESFTNPLAKVNPPLSIKVGTFLRAIQVIQIMGVDIRFQWPDGVVFSVHFRLTPPCRCFRARDIFRKWTIDPCFGEMKILKIEVTDFPSFESRRGIAAYEENSATSLQTSDTSPTRTSRSRGTAAKVEKFNLSSHQD